MLSDMHIITYIHFIMHTNTDKHVWSDDNEFNMDVSSKFPKSLTFKTPIFKFAVCPLNVQNFNFNGQLSLDRLSINRKIYYNLPNSAL